MHKYRIYIDESGDHTLYRTDEPSKRYLGLTGIMVECDYYRETFHPQLEALKQKHFPYNPDDPVIIHRENMINKQGAFWRLRDADKEKSFNEDLLKFLNDQQYIIFSVVIDKENHYKRYGEAARHPYLYSLTALLERYCGKLNFDNNNGDVLAESRGGTEDRQLKLAYDRFI